MNMAIPCIDRQDMLADNAIYDTGAMMKSLKFAYKQFTYEILDCPGTWMTEAQLETLQERLVGVAVRRLGSRPQYGFFADKRSLDNKLVTICSRDGQDLCFNAMAYLGKYRKRPVVHLGSVYSLEGQKGRMQMLYLWSSLYLLIRHGFRKIYITSLTHTPRIFGSVEKSYTKVYPCAGSDREPEPFHFEIRDLLMRTYLKEFPFMTPPAIDDHFVIKGFRRMADGSLLFPDTRVSVPKHRQPAYNAFCLERLDYENGDDILQVGIMQISNLFKNGQVFRKGGKFRPMNILHNVGAQLAALGRALGRWTSPRPFAHRRHRA